MVAALPEADHMEHIRIAATDYPTNSLLGMSMVRVDSLKLSELHAQPKISEHFQNQLRKSMYLPRMTYDIHPLEHSSPSLWPDRTVLRELHQY